MATSLALATAGEEVGGADCAPVGSSIGRRPPVRHCGLRLTYGPVEDDLAAVLAAMVVAGWTAVGNANRVQSPALEIRPHLDIGVDPCFKFMPLPRVPSAGRSGHFVVRIVTRQHHPTPSEWTGERPTQKLLRRPEPCSRAAIWVRGPTAQAAPFTVQRIAKTVSPNPHRYRVRPQRRARQ